MIITRSLVAFALPLAQPIPGTKWLLGAGNMFLLAIMLMFKGFCFIHSLILIQK